MLDRWQEAATPPPKIYWPSNASCNWSSEISETTCYRSVWQTGTDKPRQILTYSITERRQENMWREQTNSHTRIKGKAHRLCNWQTKRWKEFNRRGESKHKISHEKLYSERLDHRRFMGWYSGRGGRDNSETQTRWIHAGNIASLFTTLTKHFDLKTKLYDENWNTS